MLPGHAPCFPLHPALCGLDLTWSEQGAHHADWCWSQAGARHANCCAPLLLRPWSSITPTFAACAVFVDNARWDGVPFLLKAGKALHSRVAEIRVQVRAAVGLLAASAGCVPVGLPSSPPTARLTIGRCPLPSTKPTARLTTSPCPTLPTVPPCAGQPVPQQAGPGPGPRHQRAGGLCRCWLVGWLGDAGAGGLRGAIGWQLLWLCSGSSHIVCKRINLHCR